MHSLYILQINAHKKTKNKYMKVIQPGRTLTNNLGRTVQQSINLDKIAHVTHMLRDKIYSNKPKAAVCEPICNAIDEHRKHNVTRPVDVFLTREELCIRDYGKGLSDDDVLQVFFQYFESTKSHSNDAIGGFGIGAKAPGAYADTYYVESFFEGKRTMFVSTIDGFASNASIVGDKIDVDINDTGICVRIPIEAKDLSTFDKLIYDVVSMIGFNDDNIIQYHMIDASVDYNDILNMTNLSPIDCGRDMFKLATKDAMTYVKDEYLIVSGDSVSKPPSKFNITIAHSSSPFESSFFGNASVLAYDGDMCYNINVNNSLLDHYGINLYARRNYYGDVNSVLLLLFKRGELTITPSRETIENNDITNAWLKRKLTIVSENLLSNYNDNIRSALTDSKCLIKRINSKCRTNAKSSYISLPNYLQFAGMINKYCAIGRNITFNKDTDPEMNQPCSIKSNATLKSWTELHDNSIFILWDADERIMTYVDFAYMFNKILGNQFNTDAELTDAIGGSTNIYFIKDPAVITDFKNFADSPTVASGKILPNYTGKYLRKNIDYYYLSDLLLLDDGTRKPKAKRVFIKDLSIRPVGYSDLILSTEEEVSELYYVTRPQLNEYYQLKDIINNFRRHKDDLKTIYNIKYVAVIYVNQIKEVEALGAKPLKDYNFFKGFFDFIKSTNSIYLSSNIYDYLISVGLSINDLLSEHKDYKAMTFPQFSANRFVRAEHDNRIDSPSYNGWFDRTSLMSLMIEQFSEMFIEIFESFIKDNEDIIYKSVRAFRYDSTAIKLMLGHEHSALNKCAKESETVLSERTNALNTIKTFLVEAFKNFDCNRYYDAVEQSINKITTKNNNENSV